MIAVTRRIASARSRLLPLLRAVLALSAAIAVLPAQADPSRAGCDQNTERTTICGQIQAPTPTYSLQAPNGGGIFGQGYSVVDTSTHHDKNKAPDPETVFTIEIVDDTHFRLIDHQGKYLSVTEGGGLGDSNGHTQPIVTDARTPKNAEKYSEKDSDKGTFFRIEGLSTNFKQGVAVNSVIIHLENPEFVLSVDPQPQPDLGKVPISLCTQDCPGKDELFTWDEDTTECGPAFMRPHRMHQKTKLKILPNPFDKMHPNCLQGLVGGTCGVPTFQKKRHMHDQFCGAKSGGTPGK